MKERVIELINQIGNSLDSPAYAEKVLTECGKEILQIVGNLEEQIEILKRKWKQESMTEMEEINMRLTKEEFKAAHHNIMTVMENHIMMLAHCDRTTANLIANEVLDLDRDADRLLEEE